MQRALPAQQSSVTDLCCRIPLIAFELTIKNTGNKNSSSSSDGQTSEGDCSLALQPPSGHSSPHALFPQSSCTCMSAHQQQARNETAFSRSKSQCLMRSYPLLCSYQQNCLPRHKIPSVIQSASEISNWDI